MGEGTLPGRPAVEAALEAVLASRASLDEEIVRLEASARAAVDVKAKIKRNPVKAAGVVAGVGFLAIGGPKRLIRGARRAVMGPEEPLPKSMLPKEIDAALRKLGTDGDKVRGSIERDFSAYLDAHAKERKTRDVTAVLLSLIVGAGRGFALRGGRQVAAQLLSPDGRAYRDQLEKLRAARGERPGGDAPA
ncbi:MAG TPA: hypothetical protein VES19_13690 [Candidatus Limnocylindrales bacterium]|nr:hypothetical protein [Candidatus Limnocylindrales bacterium]